MIFTKKDEFWKKWKILDILGEWESLDIFLVKNYNGWIKIFEKNSKILGKNKGGP